MPQPKTRLYYIDNLRSFLVLLVILHHAAMPWVPGRYFISAGQTDNALSLFAGVNASFFMGALFLVSGYFHPPSLRRKGASRFILDRLLRLGLPALIYAVAVMPVLNYVSYFHIQGHEPVLSFPVALCRHFMAAIGFGHLWFVVMLLIFGIIYALWTKIAATLPGSRPKIPDTDQTNAMTASWFHKALLALAALIFVATFLVRIRFPQNSWVALPWPIIFEPAHLPQYVILFILGIHAFDRRLFQNLPTSVGLVWLVIGIVPTLVLEPLFSGDAFLGHGFTISGAASALRESLMCTGFCAGLIVIFRQKIHQSGRLSRFLSRNSYAAYIVHMPILFAIQYQIVLNPTFASLAPLTKFTLAALIGIPASFLASALLTSLPGVRRVL